MAKFSKKLINKIVALIEEDTYTTTGICKIVGISTKSFYEWRISKPEFARAINDALERREEELRMQARHALQSKLKGRTQIVSRTVYVPSDDDPSLLVIKQHVVTEKQCEPDTATIAQALNGTISGKPTENRSRIAAPPLSIKVDKEKIACDLKSLDKPKPDLVVEEKIEPPAAQTEEKALLIKEEESKESDPETKSIEVKLSDKQDLKNKWQPTPCLPPPLRGRAYRFRA